MLLYNWKIAKNGEPLTSMHNLQQHTHSHRYTHLTLVWKRYRNCFNTTNNAYFWHLSSSSGKKEKHLRPKWVFFPPFFFPLSSDTRSAVFLRTGAAQPGRGRCVDSLSLLMEKKVHNVSSVHRLTLEASQRRTKLSQSSCPPWVSGLSSGFIKLLHEGTHQGRLSHVSCGGLARGPPAVAS